MKPNLTRIKKTKKYLGVGINDLDYEVIKHERTPTGKYVCVWTDPCYPVWGGIIERVYNKNPKRHRVYIGCSLFNEWHWLSKFRSWFYDNWVEGWHLDKDILIKGNKEYCPDNCRFIPKYLNNLFTDCAANRGKWPIGVHKDIKPVVKKAKRFVARCNDAVLGRLCLGVFHTPEEAHKAWQKEKINQINKAIDRFRNEPVGYRKDVEEALLSRIKDIQNDIDNNQETIKL